MGSWPDPRRGLDRLTGICVLCPRVETVRCTNPLALGAERCRRWPSSSCHDWQLRAAKASVGLALAVSVGVGELSRLGGDEVQRGSARTQYPEKEFHGSVELLVSGEHFVFAAASKPTGCT